jgi:hypothetical protein
MLFILLTFISLLNTALSDSSFSNNTSSQTVFIESLEYATPLIMTQKIKVSASSFIGNSLVSYLGTLSQICLSILQCIIVLSIVIDIRRLIITLIGIYFEGSKYKGITSLSHLV